MELSLTPGACYWLTKAGWHPGRQISLTEFDAAYANAGIQATGIVREFLAEFGRLEGSFETTLGVRGDFAFDPRRSLENVRSTRYQDVTAEPRVPVGELPFGHAILLMTATGRTFWYFDTIGEIADAPIPTLNEIFVDAVVPESDGKRDDD